MKANYYVLKYETNGSSTARVVAVPAFGNVDVYQKVFFDSAKAARLCSSKEQAFELCNAYNEGKKDIF